MIIKGLEIPRPFLRNGKLSIIRPIEVINVAVEIYEREHS